MLLGSTPRENLELLDLIKQGEGYAVIEDILDDITLTDFQTSCLARALLTESSIVTMDTGLGKTYVASAFMKFIIKLTEKRFIFIVRNNNMEQVKEDIQKTTGLAVRLVTGREVDIVSCTSEKEMYYDVYLITYDGIVDLSLNKYLIEHKEEFIGVVIDECQYLGNVDSITSRVVSAICSKFRFKLGLSATPMTSSPDQYASAIYSIDRRMISDVEKYMRKFKTRNEKTGEYTYHDLEKMREETQLKNIGVTRREVGLEGNYKPRLISVPATREEKVCASKEVNKVIKGNPNGECVRVLLNKLWDLKTKNKIGLIYCNTNANKRMLRDTLTKEGISCEILDGTHTNTHIKKQEVQEKFRNGELDVVITNLTTGSNLPCDYILFWELTLDVVQMKGRGERGLNGKDLELIFIIAQSTMEELYFFKNVLPRCYFLRTLFGKDIDFIETVKNGIMGVGGDI